MVEDEESELKVTGTVQTSYRMYRDEEQIAQGVSSLHCDDPPGYLPGERRKY